MTSWMTAIGSTARAWWGRLAGYGSGAGAGDVVAPSRRALLTGGGAVIMGAGVTGVMVGRYSTGSDSGSALSSVLDVHQFGAAGDGRTDDTRALQKALDAAAAQGGLVFFPAGTYLTHRLTLRSRTHLRGAGGDATVLRLHPGANSAILETADFDKHTGSGSDQGQSGFSIRDLTLDGNKDENDKGGYGLRVYGYQYELTEVTIFNCAKDGLYSEWGDSAALPTPSHQMEARLTSLRVHDNGGNGIDFNGPHDSMIVNCLSFQNQGVGFRMAGNSHGTSLVNCHGWGMRQTVPFELGANAIGCVQCYADLNGGVGVRISRNNIRWTSGFVLGANHAGERREIGIQFVRGVDEGDPSGCVIDTKIMNCATAAIDFGDRLGARSAIRASLTQPGVYVDGRLVQGTGAGWSGTPHWSARLDVVEGVSDAEKNYVVTPPFELRAQAAPGGPPSPESVRVFARVNGGATQLCAQLPNGVIKVIATE